MRRGTAQVAVLCIASALTGAVLAACGSSGTQLTCQSCTQDLDCNGGQFCRQYVCVADGQDPHRCPNAGIPPSTGGSGASSAGGTSGSSGGESTGATSSSSSSSSGSSSSATSTTGSSGTSSGSSSASSSGSSSSSSTGATSSSSSSSTSSSGTTSASSSSGSTGTSGTSGCTNTQSDPFNCGTCGNVCSGVGCTHGHCDSIASEQDVSGLVLWLDASQPSTVSLDPDAGTVAVWHDLGPNGLDVSQPQPAFQPAYDGTSLVFTLAKSQWMIRSTFSGLPVGTADRTSFYVASLASTDNGYQTVAAYGSENTFTKWGLSSSVNGTVYLTTTFGGINSSLPWPSQPTIVRCVGSGGSVTLVVNGQLVQQQSDAFNTDPTGTLSISTQPTGGPGEYWNGTISEVITYNSALSDAQAAQVENYLSAKWQIPVTH